MPAQEKCVQRAMVAHKVDFEGEPLTVLEIEGQPWFIAKDLGVRLGYSHGGRRLVAKIKSDWSNEFTEGLFFKVLQGPYLSDLKKLDTGSVSSRTPRLTLLSEAGVNMVCIKTAKPVGMRLRHWLATEVLPTLRREGSYSAERPPRSEQHQPLPDPVPTRPVSAARLREERLARRDQADAIRDLAVRLEGVEDPGRIMDLYIRAAETQANCSLREILDRPQQPTEPDGRPAPVVIEAKAEPIPQPAEAVPALPAPKPHQPADEPIDAGLVAPFGDPDFETHVEAPEMEPETPRRAPLAGLEENGAKEWWTASSLLMPYNLKPQSMGAVITRIHLHTGRDLNSERGVSKRVADTAPSSGRAIKRRVWHSSVIYLISEYARRYAIDQRRITREAPEVNPGAQKRQPRDTRPTRLN